MIKKLKEASKLSLISAILGIMYSIYLLDYFGSLEGSGSSIAISLVMPHLMAVLASTILNVILVFKDKKGIRIATFVMWTVSGVLFMLYFIMILPMFILSLIKMIKGTKLKSYKAYNELEDGEIWTEPTSS